MTFISSKCTASLHLHSYCTKLIHIHLYTESHLSQLEDNEIMKLQLKALKWTPEKLMNHMSSLLNIF